MSGRRYQVLIAVFLLTLMVVNGLVAGTTGKIAGKVIDKSTGEPLIGVNVVVKGTRLGASTDVNGNYAILLVPPGRQSVTASLIGYPLVTVEDIDVRVDQTSPVNISLTPQAINVGDVIVVAERNLVKKDVSSSVVAVQQEEISALPVTTIQQVVGLQAGVENGLEVRGGSSDALLMQLDGVTLRDPRNNKPIASVPLSAIAEVSIERGGFNAEYGQVRSGIINIIGKEGNAQHYQGSMQVKYSPPQPKHFGMSVYDPNSMWNRPYLDPAVCWTGTKNGAWDLYQQRQYPEFVGWNAISDALMKDGDPSNDLSPAGAQRVWEWERRRQESTKSPDYNIDGSFGGPVPFVSEQLGNLRFFTSFMLNREMLLIPLSRDDYKEYTWSAKVNSDVANGMTLAVTASGGKTYNVALNADDRQFNNPAWGINGLQFWNATDYMRTPYQIAEITNEQRPSRIFDDGWYSEADVSYYTMAAKLTKFITSSTFYEVSVEHVHRSYLTGPIRPRNTSTLYEIVPGYFVDEAPFGFSSSPSTGLTGMFFGGHSATIRDSSVLSSYVAKVDISSQLNQVNLIKAGLEFSYYDLNLDYGLVNEAFGGTNFVKQKWNPYRLSAYVQDKIEALGFIANLGLRMDMSNPNTMWADVGTFDQAYFSTDYSTNPNIPMKKAKIDWALSPRLGISHPITEDSKLYFNYGHFKEMPAYEETFRIGRGPSGNMLNYGNADIIQAKTISYQLGYDHVLFESYLLQLAAFYNDISDQQGYTQYVSDQKNIGYFQANNNSYQDVRGFEATLKKTEGEWVRGFINYTYQVSTQGAFGKQTINENPSEQKLIDQNTLVLYQQKPIPQPHARASLTFFTERDFGPEYLGIQPLGSWSLNVLLDWKSGEYYTYNPKSLQDVVNNVQVKDYFNIDLRLNKTFDIKPLTVMLFMEVTNLLNTKRLSGASFYDVYDQNYYLQSLHLPESNAYDNIPGEDRIGEVRKAGVDYQPIEQEGNVNNMTVAEINPRVIYYDRTTRRYMNYVNGAWAEVDKGRMQKVLDDKAYIDMPNNTSFDFLNPRQFYFGINVAFNF